MASDLDEQESDGVAVELRVEGKHLRHLPPAPGTQHVSVVPYLPTLPCLSLSSPSLSLTASPLQVPLGQTTHLRGGVPRGDDLTHGQNDCVVSADHRRPDGSHPRGFSPDPRRAAGPTVRAVVG